MHKPTVVDLFSGCGGMSWGLHKAGFKVIAGIDKWDRALETFALNHVDGRIICADIASLDAEDVMSHLGLTPGSLDCLVGGPPCQGFSKNVPATYRFLEDPRNQLFRDFLRFVGTFLPKVVVMENVAEIRNAYEGSVTEEIVNDLTRMGYDVDVQVLLVAQYGVPQRRRRCFFFASRGGTRPAFPEPSFGPIETRDLFREVREYRSAWSAISDLPILKNGEGFEPMDYVMSPQNDFQEEMRAVSSELFDHITRRLNAKQFARVSSLQAGEGLRELPESLRPKSGYSGAYGRLDFQMLAPTITRWVFHPGSGRFCHPREPRLITIREAARIQSFSDDFRFTGTYIEKSHQVGNAVPPMVMEMMAQNIRNCL